jgi:hypothetical protein
VQTPPTHAWFVQGTAWLQLPVESHVWTPLPEHWTWPGVHGPTQALATHDCAHRTAGAQVPLEVHVSTPAFRHCVLPGTQTPVQAPSRQV